MSDIASKKNIIYMIDGLGMGGAERLMIPILGHIDHQRFNVRVCVLQSKHGNPLADDIRTLNAPVDFVEVKHLRDIQSLWRLRNYLKHTHADLLHTQLEFSNILGNISAKLLRLPSVCTVHVLPPSNPDFKTRLHQRTEWLALRLFCNRVITVSEETRRQYILHSGIPNRKLLTIYNGIDLTNFQRLEPDPQRVALRNEFRLPDDSNLLITVAVLRQLKGIEYMLRALPDILRAHPNTYYLIVGDGPHREALSLTAQQAGVQEHVIFAGTRNDIPHLLSASDIFILPTLTEALPTVLAEAMACRLPIVASAVGGVPEMVVDGVNGILVQPANPAELSQVCNNLLAHPDKLSALGESGWSFVNQKFNINQQVTQLQDLYLEQIERHGN